MKTEAQSLEDELDLNEQISLLNTHSSKEKIMFMATYTGHDILRNKCQVILAFCAVTAIFLTCLLTNTLIEKCPLIFLKVAEIESGNHDGKLMLREDM